MGIESFDQALQTCDFNNALGWIDGYVKNNAI